MIDKIDYTQARESYHDPMIKSFFLMAPAYGDAFDKKGLQLVSSPVFIIAGAEDNRVPVKENAIFFSENIKESKLKIFPGKLGHFVFLNLPTAEGKRLLPSFLIEDAPSVNRSRIHEETLNLMTSFLEYNALRKL